MYTAPLRSRLCFRAARVSKRSRQFRDATLRILLYALLTAAPAAAQMGNATWATPVAKSFNEPAWWDQGVVFVGNWEPLIFRVRHGSVGVDPEKDYRREHTEETVLKLKEAGVNMIVTHFYKTGLDSEREDVELAKELARLCHKHGMKIGTYIGGTMFAETLLRDIPESKNWVRYDEHGDAVRYGEQTYRYRPDFNHPGYVEYMKKVVRVAIEDVKTDFIHFDNMALIAPPWTGNTPEVNRRFREFLAKKYTPAQLKQRLGFSDISAVTVPTWHNLARPAAISPVIDPVMQEWVDFRCQDFAAYYAALCDYARTLKPDIMMELNPHGIYGSNRAFLNAIDHARLVPHGSVFWSEEPNEAHVTPEGILVSKIRSLKLARSLDQSLFIYTGAQRGEGTYRLYMAESMAFNRNCLGDLGGPLDAYTFPEGLRRYVRFYMDQNRNFAGTRVVADVAVLRSFPSLAYNSIGPHLETTLVEQTLIQHKVPFEYVFDGNLGNLSKYRAVILADQESLSDRAVEQLREYVRNGGGLVATGRTSLYNDWRRMRPDYALADVLGVHAAAGGSMATARELPAARRGAFGKGRAAYLPAVTPAQPIPNLDAMGAGGFGSAHWRLPANAEEIVAALRYAAGGPFAAEFEQAPLTTVMELTEKTDGGARMLHWVNYKPGTKVAPAGVTVAVPQGGRVTAVEVLSPDHAPRTAQFTVEGGRVRFTMPAPDVYEMAVIRLAR